MAARVIGDHWGVLDEEPDEHRKGVLVSIWEWETDEVHFVFTRADWRRLKRTLLRIGEHDDPLPELTALLNRVPTMARSRSVPFQAVLDKAGIWYRKTAFHDVDQLGRQGAADSSAS